MYNYRKRDFFFLFVWGNYGYVSVYYWSWHYKSGTNAEFPFCLFLSVSERPGGVGYPWFLELGRYVNAALPLHPPFQWKLHNISCLTRKLCVSFRLGCPLWSRHFRWELAAPGSARTKGERHIQRYAHSSHIFSDDWRHCLLTSCVYVLQTGLKLLQLHSYGHSRNYTTVQSTENSLRAQEWRSEGFNQKYIDLNYSSAAITRRVKNINLQDGNAYQQKING